MGFSITKEFPGRFVRGDDVAGMELKLVIRDVQKDNVYNTKTNQNEQRLVLFFEGKEKGVILSKSRAMDIKDITGSDDTDGWKGKTVCMFTVKKKGPSGKMVNVIRFKAPQA